MRRKKHSRELKAKVAIAALKGQKTVGELATEYVIHPTLVNRWKKQAEDGMVELFREPAEKDLRAAESERDRLYQQIGRLQVELDWLKKKSGTLL